MTESQFHASQAIQRAAGHLVAQASQAGLVVTIETTPQQPLAMGNFAITVSVREARHAPAPAASLGMFGHHPDPAIDFMAEVEAIEAERTDLAAGLPPTMDLQARTDRAMTFRVGGDAGAIVAKTALRASTGQTALIQRTATSPTFAELTIGARDLDTLAQMYHAHGNALQALININQDDERVYRWRAQYQTFRDLYGRLHRGEPHEFTQAARDVLTERWEQVHLDWHELKQDDSLVNDELAAMACFYAMPPGARDWKAIDYGDTWGEAIRPENWNFQTGDRRRELVKAAALALAEIERMDRAAAKGGA